MAGAALGVDVDQPDVQGQEPLQGPAHGVGDVVQLEVQEDGGEGLHLLHEGRPFRAEQLEPDLQHADPSLEPARKGQGLLSGGHVEGDHEAFGWIKAQGHADSVTHLSVILSGMSSGGHPCDLSA